MLVARSLRAACSGGAGNLPQILDEGAIGGVVRLELRRFGIDPRTEHQAVSRLRMRVTRWQVATSSERWL